MGFTGVPPSTNLHLLFGIFLLHKKPLAVIPRPSKYSGELNSRLYSIISGANEGGNFLKD